MRINNQLEKYFGSIHFTFGFSVFILVINVILSQAFNLGLITNSLLITLCTGVPLILTQPISASIVITDNLQRIWLMLGHWRTQWYPVLPEVQKVLDEMGYSKKIKFGFRPDIKTAYTCFNSIVFDPELFFSLSSKQVQSIVAHEVHHMQNKYIKYFLGIALVAEIVGVCSLFALPKLMFTIAAMSMIQLLMTLISWKSEYEADVSGAKYTSKDTMLSVLTFFKKYFGDKASLSHPSASARIKNIQNTIF